MGETIYRITVLTACLLTIPATIKLAGWIVSKLPTPDLEDSRNLDQSAE